MNIRKLLDWRKLLIYSHRWLGIAIILMFLVWTVSGVVLMYYGHPQLTTGERLMRLEPLDVSTVTVTPAEAMAVAKIKPSRMRVSMYDGRPVYRFSGAGSGQWPAVYADTGEKLPDMGREKALAWMRRFAPEHAATMQYDAYLESPDEFTRIPTLAGFAPLHRIAMNDAAGTEFYVAEKSNDVVLKTDRRGRVLAFSGYIVHNLFFFRQRTWWEPLMRWLVWIGIVMGATGIAVGIWRVGLRARYRHKGVPSHSPYKGWMKWHHYAGLIFGLFMFTWILSGSIPVPAFPVPNWDRVAKRLAGQGDGFLVGNPTISPTSSMSKDMAQAVTGGPLDLKPITVENLRKSVTQIETAFKPAEIELVQFRGEPYFIAYQPPQSQQQADRWFTNNAISFLSIAQDDPHVFVSLRNPEKGVFTRFSNETMEQMAREAMPGTPVRDIQWLNEYDNYYHQTVPSFELGRLKPAYTLPVLRVRYEDPKATWLYFTPSHGQMVKFETRDRANRWLYYGLHAMDWPGLFSRRPLWDIVTITLLAGCAVLSFTTLVPAYRRLKRQAVRRWHWAFPPRKVGAPAPGLAMSKNRE